MSSGNGRLDLETKTKTKTKHPDQVVKEKRQQPPSAATIFCGAHLPVWTQLPYKGEKRLPWGRYHAGDNLLE